MGVLLQHLTADNGGKPTFTGNTFDGNWYSDFENRWDTDYVISLSGNTFTNGTTTIKVGATGEPSASKNFTRPAAQVANIVTAVESNVTLN